MTSEVSELAVYRRLFDEKYAQMAELLDGLPPEALIWKPFEHSPWRGPSNSLGFVVAHAVSSTVYLLRQVEYCLGRIPWEAVDGDEGPEEFGPANHDLSYLQARVQRTHTYVRHLLTSLIPGDLDASQNHPQHADQQLSVRYAIGEAIEHMSQHIGHGQLTRQLWALQRDSSRSA
jgi:hypothetical protein